jgi:K+-sensing histidine kinase KdpD
LNFPLGAHGPLFEGSWNRICCVVRQHSAGVGVVLTLLLCCIVSPQLNARFGDVGMRAVAVSFPLGMILVAVRFGIGPAVVTAGLGAFALDHVFVQPLLASAIPSVRDRVTIGLIGASAAAAAAYAERLRRRAASARRKTEIEGLRNELLSALSEDLRAPLAALVTAGRALLEDELAFSARHDLSDVVFTETAQSSRSLSSRGWRRGTRPDAATSKRSMRSSARRFIASKIRCVIARYARGCRRSCRSRPSIPFSSSTS